MKKSMELYMNAAGWVIGLVGAGYAIGVHCKMNAETFDPNAYVSLKVKSHSSTQDISAMLKNVQEIQMLLLRLAIKLVKISKEVE